MTASRSHAPSITASQQQQRRQQYLSAAITLPRCLCLPLSMQQQQQQQQQHALRRDNGAYVRDDENGPNLTVDTVTLPS